jgi:hypothetical protein
MAINPNKPKPVLNGLLAIELELPVRPTTRAMIVNTNINKSITKANAKLEACSDNRPSRPLY